MSSIDIALSHIRIKPEDTHRINGYIDASNNGEIVNLYPEHLSKFVAEINLLTKGNNKLKLMRLNWSLRVTFERIRPDNYDRLIEYLTG